MAAPARAAATRAVAAAAEEATGVALEPGEAATAAETAAGQEGPREAAERAAVTKATDQRATVAEPAVDTVAAGTREGGWAREDFEG